MSAVLALADASGKVFAFDPAESRDDHGRWSDGGSSSWLHGTAGANAEKILAEGLRGGMSGPGVYASKDLRQAMNYATGATRHWGEAKGLPTEQIKALPVALVVLRKFDAPSVSSGDNYGYVPNPVQAEDISRIELYRLGDVTPAAIKAGTLTPIRILSKETHHALDGSVLYVVVSPELLLGEAVLKYAGWDEGAHPRGKTTAGSRGGSFAPKEVLPADASDLKNASLSPDYAYHGTHDFNRVVSKGLDPGSGVDGKTYFSVPNVWPGTRDSTYQGMKLLRIRLDRMPTDFQTVNFPFTTAQRIDQSQIEYYGVDKKWHSLDQIKVKPFKVLAYADEHGHVTPLTSSDRARSRVLQSSDVVGPVLALADAAGRVYAEWDLATPQHEPLPLSLSKGGIVRPLYVSRPVENADEIIQWAKSVGFQTTLPVDDMHVTVCYSKEPVDWLALDHDNMTLEVPPEGVRTLAWDESQHPREPAGSDKGGEFTGWGDLSLEGRTRRAIRMLGGWTADEYTGEARKAAAKLLKQTLPGGLLEHLHPGEMTVYRGGKVFKGKLPVSWAPDRKTAEFYGKDVITRQITRDTPALSIDKLYGRPGAYREIIAHQYEQYADRTITTLGDKNAVVLQFESAPLQARHQYFMDHGASWDYDGYRPHITLTYEAPAGLGLSTVEPYTGRIVLGPEVFAEVEEDWAEDVEELAQEEDGVWRTIRGRKVFIRSGETPTEAINRSKLPEDLSSYRKAAEDKLTVLGPQNPKNEVLVYYGDREARKVVGWPDGKIGVLIGSEKETELPEELTQSPIGYVDKPRYWYTLHTHPETAGATGSIKPLGADDLNVMSRVYSIASVEAWSPDGSRFSVGGVYNKDKWGVVKSPMNPVAARQAVMSKIRSDHPEFRGNRDAAAIFVKDHSAAFEHSITQGLHNAGQVIYVAKLSSIAKKVFTRQKAEIAAWTSVAEKAAKEAHYKQHSYVDQSVPPPVEIDYAQIKNDLDNLEAKFRTALREALVQSRDAVLSKVRRGKGVLPKDFTLPYAKDIQGVIRDALQRAMDKGGVDAGKEIGRVKKGVKVHTYATPTFTPTQALAWLREKAFWVADVLTGGLTEDIRLAIINGLRDGTATDEIVTNVAYLYIPYLGDPTKVKGGELPSAARLETVVRTNITEAYNQGRIATFVRPDMMPFLDGIEYSAIMDSRTTQVCQYLNGRIFHPEDIQITGLVPPNHFGCRSLVIPRVVGDLSKPPDYKVDPSVYITDEQILHAQSLADAKFLEQEDYLTTGDVHVPGPISGAVVEPFKVCSDCSGSTAPTCKKNKQCLLEKEKSLAFDPSEARDAHGRWTSGRTSRALRSYIPITKAKRDAAEKYEATVAKAIGGKNLGDHEPFDVIKGRQAVEVKAIMPGAKNPKCTMHKESLARKANFLRDEKMTGHTVVVDARGARPVYYYHAGVGSFRLSGMQTVTTTELKGLIK